MDFSAQYSREAFLSFLRNLMPDFSPRSHAAEIKHDPRKDDYITGVRLLGETGDSILRSSHDTGAVLEITHGSENDPRVSITREAFRVFRQTDFNIGLVAFVSEESPNWRLSLITSDVVLEDGEVKESFSNPRRYSFFMGPDAKTRTPREFLLEKGTISDFDDLKARFDVRVLTKEFYQELSNWYFWALDNITFPEGVQEIEGGRNVAVIRMITRIVFIWFMKRKGLIPERLFEEDFVIEILRDVSPQNSTFYKAILQNLFFATLNTPIEKRGFRERRSFQGKNKDFMNHSIYRYEDLFQNPDEIMGYFKDIPFLNGGLFECLDDRHEENGENKYMRIDGFSDRDDNPLHVPNRLFWSGQRDVDISEHFETGHTAESVRGLISILSDYNFTVDENTPIDQEVSLDPELLGRIFENLLASYNSESATTTRKATGSYYTPRPIVEYMVDESLKGYFEQALADAEHSPKEIKNKLDDLLSYEKEGHDFSVDETETLIDSIESLKIIDPAVGSGAFPMGMLQKMVLVLSKLDPKNKGWKKRQIRAIEDNVTDPELKRKHLSNIEDSFKSNQLNYGRKLYLIRDCIYGVDIQPVATQIARLRFFISLLVDESIDDSQTSKGVEPLPNLETKFVAGDSLISFTGQSSLKPNKARKLERDLGKIREEHFNESDPKEKQNLRQKDKEIREQLAEAYEEADFSGDKLSRLKDWSPYDPNSSADFFDPKWMFGIERGFDIVIANPPYIQLQKNSGRLADRYEDEGYETFRRRGDIYCLFYERGLNLAKKGSGILCYITSNKWMRAKYGKPLRKFLSRNNPLKLINFGGYKVFQQTVDTNILLATNRGVEIYGSSPHKTNGLIALKAKQDFKEEANLLTYFDENKVTMGDLSEDPWFVGTPKEMKLKEKIERIGTPLGQWNVNINYGIKTGRNKAFIIDENKRAELIDKDPRSEEIIKPILRGKNIKKYGCEFGGEYVLLAKFGSYKTLPRRYPAVYNHLKKYEKTLKKRGQCNYSSNWSSKSNKDYPGQHHWLELDNNPTDEYLEKFEKGKIVYPETTHNASFFYDKKGRFYVEKTAFIMTGEATKYLTGILGSSLFSFGFKRFYSGVELSDSGYQYNKHALLKAPVPKVNAANDHLAENIESLVDKLLQKKNENSGADTTALESRIDQLVYELYELTPDEIKVVEGSR